MCAFKNKIIIKINLLKLFNYPIPLAQKKWDSAWMLLAHSLDAPASTLQHCQAGQSGGRVFACPVDSGMKGRKGTWGRL